MANQRRFIQVIPSATRLISSLRDIGYDFTHAVADLVDNSIAANASTISVDMRFDGADSWLRLADDGAGMNGTTLTEAMRFGSEREYGPDELGKFGLGLKTASLSQCSRLTVASRESTTTRRIAVRQWDLAHVKASKKWEIIDLPHAEWPDKLVEPIKNGSGTVVLWEKLERVMGYKILWGDRAKAGFLKLAEELDLHLGMVFHRFLTGEAKRKKKLQITINGTAVAPWDPFARDELGTIALPNKQIVVSGDEGPGFVAYAPYILPAQDKFSSLRAFNRQAGPSKWNFQQGFYVYRADRMIQSGGWSHMRTSDEHTKLARVGLYFWPDLDSAFDLNVAKARVNLPAELRAELKTQIENLVRQARHVYAASSGSTSSKIASGTANQLSIGSAHVRSSGPSSPDTGSSSVSAGAQTSSAHEREAHSYRTVGSALEHAAHSVHEERALFKICEALKHENAKVAELMGWL